MKRKILLAQEFFLAVRKKFLLQVKSLRKGKKNVLLLHREDIFLASEIISVGDLPSNSV